MEHDIHCESRSDARAHDELEVMKADVAPEPPLDPEYPEADHIDHADQREALYAEAPILVRDISFEAKGEREEISKHHQGKLYGGDHGRPVPQQQPLPGCRCALKQLTGQA